jgi:hypothetical protein
MRENRPASTDISFLDFKKIEGAVLSSLSGLETTFASVQRGDQQRSMHQSSKLVAQATSSGKIMCPMKGSKYFE